MQNGNLYVLRKMGIVVIGLFISMNLFAQQSKKTNTATDTSGINAVINYDEFFSLLDQFFDSLYAPRSFTVVSTGITSNYYNFTNSRSNKVNTVEKITFSPSIGYYDKSGLGINATASIINYDQKLHPYQYALSGSYDYIKNRKLATGISFTRYFTEDSLPFYTSPLQNQVSTYFTYRKWWIRPLITANYGWGNRSSYTETTEIIKKKIIKQKGKPPRYINTTTTTINESVNDFTVAATIKHDFYWLDVVSKKDFIRLTPQFTFTSGTQKFGFNQVSNIAISNSITGVNILTDSKSVYLDNSANFRPLALTAFLKSEFSIGKFFVQPQVMVDYYIPGLSDNISTAYALNTGFIF